MTAWRLRDLVDGERETADQKIACVRFQRDLSSRIEEPAHPKCAVHGLPISQCVEAGTQLILHSTLERGSQSETARRALRRFGPDVELLHGACLDFANGRRAWIVFDAQPHVEVGERKRRRRSSRRGRQCLSRGRRGDGR